MGDFFLERPDFIVPSRRAFITQAIHDRFLSRPFLDGERSEWLLKGGGAMLARVHQARATKDIDLAATESDLGEAEAALEAAARLDLGDHLRFDLVRSRTAGQGQNRPDVSSRRLVFAAVDREIGRMLTEVSVDIVAGPPPIGTVELRPCANRLILPRPLPSPPYRLFPIADQITEKVCATMQRYDGRESTRVKDLVDLVSIARSQKVNRGELTLAIEETRRRRGMERFTRIQVPSDWARP